MGIVTDTELTGPGGLLDGLALVVVLGGLVVRMRPATRCWAPRGARARTRVPARALV